MMKADRRPVTPTVRNLWEKRVLIALRAAASNTSRFRLRVANGPENENRPVEVLENRQFIAVDIVVK